MGIFDRFPYSSTHEMNLDFMLGKATEIAESLQEIDTHTEQAEQAATNAAQSAQSAAQAAQAAAGSQTAAGTSASQAAQHKADAEDAANRAEAASDLADEAVEQAQTAVTQAQTAATNASTAADGAIAGANAAETRINTLAASLPEDFTELNTEVNNLKSEMEYIPNDFVRNIGYYISKNQITDPWRQGYYSPNVGSYTSSSTRCCTPNHIQINNETDSVLLKMPSNMKGRLTFVNENNQVIQTSSDANWTEKTFSYNVPNGAVSVLVSVAYIDNSAITPEDCDQITLFSISGILNSSKYFNGKRISILGDSISTFAGSDAEPAGDGHTIADGEYTYAGNHCRYPTTYLTNVDDTYWKKLIDSLGMVLGVNDSWAGSKVSWNGGETSDTGANIYIASQTRINHIGLNGTPDFILVNAGTNDINNSILGTFNTESPKDYTNEQIANLPVATFADAYRALLIRLQKTYPNSRIVVMLPDYTTSYYDPTKADSYLEIIKEECDYFGVPWVDMRTVGITMYNTGTYLGDGIHPNIEGMNLLYKKLEKFFVYTL